MDEIKDPKLSITENTPGQNQNIPFQLVQFISWESTPFGRKEMQTSFPIMLTVPESGSLFDLRKAVAEKINLPYRNINLAFTNSFPILEGRISPVRDIIKNNAPNELLALNKDTNPTSETTTETTPSLTTSSTTSSTTTTTITTTISSSSSSASPMDQDEDEDAKENLLAEQENRDKRTFNFKAEKAVPIKKAKFSPLDVLCWEDLRVKVEKTDPYAHPPTRGANKKGSSGGSRDSEVLKIKN